VINIAVEHASEFSPMYVDALLFRTHGNMGFAYAKLEQWSQALEHYE
jgi:hypothetical protein